MKLKKIASLALAGIMAVSMLAGCGTQNGGSSDNGNTVVEPTASVAVKAFNDAQTKITFTADSTLETQLAQAVKEMGEDAGQASVAVRLQAISGIIDEGYASKSTANEDGLVKTNLYVVQLSSSAAVKNYYLGTKGTMGAYEDLVNNVVTVLPSLSMNVSYDENVASKYAAGFMGTVTKSLAETTDETPASGATYYDYDYTGKVGMVTVKTSDGNTNYYIAFTVTQTSTEGTVA